ncbi:MAG: SDR family oxidoreductase [Bacteroidota bacterium]
MSKLAIVTGGTKGIGKAIIMKFAQAGFDIVTCSRHQDQLNELKTTVEGLYPQVKVHARQVDMSVKAQVLEFGKFILSLGEPIEILVNNAGFFMPGQVHAEEDGNMEKMVEANLYSAYYMTRSVIAPMIERKQGYIFNICSIASLVAYPNGGSYSISKFAMLGMSKALREEMKEHNIRVTSVMPGATLTASWEGVDLPEERFCKAEDIADAVHAAYALSTNSVVEELIIRPQLGDI